MSDIDELHLPFALFKFSGSRLSGMALDVDSSVVVVSGLVLIGVGWVDLVTTVEAGRTIPFTVSGDWDKTMVSVPGTELELTVVDVCVTPRKIQEWLIWLLYDG